MITPSTSNVYDHNLSHGHWVISQNSNESHYFESILLNIGNPNDSGNLERIGNTNSYIIKNGSRSIRFYIRRCFNTRYHISGNVGIQNKFIFKTWIEDCITITRSNSGLNNYILL